MSFSALNIALLVVVYCHRLQGRAKVVEAELVTLGEQRVQTSEGTRAMALELCREFEDTFLLHIQTGEVKKHKSANIHTYIRTCIRFEVF
jgi:hypothetical protein